MLDYRMHYAVMVSEDRLRQPRPSVITRGRGPRRVFRLGGGQGEARPVVRR